MKKKETATELQATIKTMHIKHLRFKIIFSVLSMIVYNLLQLYLNKTSQIHDTV